MPTSHTRTSLTDGIPAKKPVADPAPASNKARTIAIVAIFLVLGLGVAYMYYEPKPAKSDYEPPPEAAPEPGKPVRPNDPPPPIPPPPPGTRPTITG